MKTNESIVLIPNAEAYSRIYVSTGGPITNDHYHLGYVLLAVVLSEDVIEYGTQNWDQAQQKNVRSPDVVRNQLKFIYGVKPEAAMVEYEKEYAALGQARDKLRGEVARSEGLIRQLIVEHHKEKEELADLRRNIELQAASITRLRDEADKAVAAKRTLEIDMGKVRAHIGQKALDEALGKK
jgi:hypothetical protein